MGKDHTLYALQPGYIKFYSSSLPFPHPQSPPTTSTSTTPTLPASSPTDQTLMGVKQSLLKRPRGKDQFIGVVGEREKKLFGDETGDVFGGGYESV